MGTGLVADSFGEAAAGGEGVVGTSGDGGAGLPTGAGGRRCGRCGPSFGVVCNICNMIHLQLKYYAKPKTKKI